MRVLVAGAGIGGLSAGIALARRGIEVEVVEAKPVDMPVGVGLVLPAKLQVTGTGDTLADLVQTAQVSVDVNIPESDAVLLQSGERASIKLESFPVHTFHGTVTVVSPQGQVQQDNRFFIARVNVSNEGGRIRPGMQGLGKISVGWHSAGYVFFRGTAMWIWGKLWSWFGW